MIGENNLSIPAKMLDVYALRQKLTAHNVANADVPGYRKLEANFGKELQQAIKSGDPEQIRKAGVSITRARQPGVQTETEIAEMTKNELLFNAFAEIATFRLRLLRTAIGHK